MATRDERAGMQPVVLIADTFRTSLARLTADEQRAAKTTVFDLQAQPDSHGLRFHRLDRVRDNRFWSVRVSGDVRIIVHRDGGSTLLCYVDHHDKAYDWAERRKLEVHPTTGAAQLVEIRERVVEIPVPVRVPVADAVESPSGTSKGEAHPEPPRLLFGGRSVEELMRFGVPEEWVADVLAATEDSLFVVAEHLPQEAAEALLELATGGKPVPAPVAEPLADPFAHPDAQRRFRVMQNREELERALAYPWEQWSVFLHPAQRELVERAFSGPARVAGTAGTGKTIVALHRSVYLAKQRPDATVLLTTFSVTLARQLQQKLRRLTLDDSALAARIRVAPLDDVGIALYEERFGTPRMVTDGMLRSLIASVIREAAGQMDGVRVSEAFLYQEWTDVVDAWQITTETAYLEVKRLGRRTQLGQRQRRVVWSILSLVRERLLNGALFTPAMLYAAVVDDAVKSGRRPFEHAVVDESQDINVQQLRFLAAIAGSRPDGLFFSGDLGQRIFQTPFSWKALGVDVRGRSSTLRINYRTSHQIRRMADRLLGQEVSDVDGNVESRSGTISVFEGPDPLIQLFPDREAEKQGIASWLSERRARGMAPEELAVFVRSAEEIPRATAALALAGLTATSPAAGVDPEPGKVVVLPMHLAKGLEFRAVVVAACDDDVIPLRSRMEDADEGELEEVYDTERQLLYVACTRARDELLVTAVEPGSEFLSDL
jgi:mRNA-degrading endonuclease RelE of RelBE toxin-antitoxin system